MAKNDLEGGTSRTATQSLQEVFPPTAGRNAPLRQLNTLLPAAPTRRRKLLGSKHLRYGLTKSMTVSTTLVSKMLPVALADGGGGGGGIASPVGMLPASVLTETSAVSITAITKRFIFEFLLRMFEGCKNTCIRNTKPMI